MPSISLQYDALIAAGKIERDDAQETVVARLTELIVASPSIGWRANRHRWAGCSAPASAAATPSEASTSSAMSAAAKPC